ncbi:MAG TPA: undecaprenyl-diphosphate phosphatase [Mycobacteriales bacterium]|nr:undecaprenyl-diphosphate phosphatase [Mycobacteriales bacterium]
MNTLQAVVLGVVEGLTEFLPVSSTGHLLIAEHLMGLPNATQQEKDSLIGFTAVIQTGAIAAAVLYFVRDIAGLAGSFLGGMTSRTRRGSEEFRFALAVLVGSLPIALVGLALKDAIKEMDTHLWVVAVGLIAFSAVFVVAERFARQDRPEQSLTVKDGLVIGLGQCLALVPGVSRSGATISIGLLRGLDRVAATRLSFLLGIPALLGAGVLGLKDATHNEAGASATVVATVVAFVVAYASIWGLLRFVGRHRITAFVPYRVLLGVAVLVGLAVG